MLELESVLLKSGAQPITHRFEAGRITVVLGRNHSGKTLLTRTLAGLEGPLAGDIRLDGESLVGISPGERSVALVYQAFVNYPGWSVFENIASPLKARRVDAAEVEATVQDLAEKLELDGLLDRLPEQLSGGQQQRVAIGRALAKGADVLVMDEPLVNLDYKLREALQLELAALLHELGLTVIYTSSDPRDAFALGDDLVLLAEHSLLQSGTPLDLYEAPATPAACDLMSDPRACRSAAGCVPRGAQGHRPAQKHLADPS
ncbi:MAG: ABC transporter ATP-binding protein, partial [Pseudomonadota bacterium]